MIYSYQESKPNHCIHTEMKTTFKDKITHCCVRFVYGSFNVYYILLNGYLCQKHLHNFS